MKSPLTLYKLIVLYLLDRIDEPVSNLMVTDFLLDENVTNNYLSVQTAIHELEDSGLVTTETMGNRTMIRITKEGEETLHFFQNEINPDIRRQCDTYMKQNGLAFRDEAQTTARYYRKITGDYEVELGVRDKDAELFKVTMTVPDAQMAESAVRNFSVKKDGIYRMLTDTLFGKDNG